jgi:BirA family transcriptional regulator, biotin operon repressor / biotin---[acetyl-CoA-carboxylase] ligase
MDQIRLEHALARLNLVSFRYLEKVGSTNDFALRWAEDGAPDLALVVAGEQTAGRGRAGRRWYSPPNASLSFSMVIYPDNSPPHLLSRFTALGSLAVCKALRADYGLSSQIKWPNDVLVNRRKIAGVLAEAYWAGDNLEAVILGIGANVGLAAVAETGLPSAQLLFPATCLEREFGKPVERLDLLGASLRELLNWRGRLDSPEFLQAWESSLAFKGEWVQIFPADSPSLDSLPVQEGAVIGLAPDGSLKLHTKTGDEVVVTYGDLRLRPVS